MEPTILGSIALIAVVAIIMFLMRDKKEKVISGLAEKEDKVYTDAEKEALANDYLTDGGTKAPVEIPTLTTPADIENLKKDYLNIGVIPTTPEELDTQETLMKLSKIKLVEKATEVNANFNKKETKAKIAAAILLKLK